MRFKRLWPFTTSSVRAKVRWLRHLRSAVSFGVVFSLVTTALIITTAPVASAATGDLVVSMSVDDLDPAVLQRAINTFLPGGNAALSTDIGNAIQTYHLNVASDGSTFQGFTGGTLAMSSVGAGSTATDTLTITIPAGDVHTNLADWVITTIAAISGGVGATIASALCFAAFAPAAVAAPAVCGAIFGFTIAFVWNIVSSKLHGKSWGDPSIWANAFAAGIVSALAGTAWGLKIGPWAAANARPLMVALGKAIGRGVANLVGWIGSGAAALGSGIATLCTAVGDLLTAAFQAAASAFDIPSSTSPQRLKVLPFGDSITYGYQSSDGSGYRCPLQGFLGAQQDVYSFVGSQSAGGCAQPQNEGHSGWTISQLAAIEGCTIGGYQPNVVLLDIGTNDINNGGSSGAAATAIENLIGNIHRDDPSAVVLVSSLIPTANATVAAKMADFNQTVSSWVATQKADGMHFDWVDQGAIETTDLADGLHPNDVGYTKMAGAWNFAVASAVTSSWIAAPAAGGAGCAGGAPVWYPQGEIASGPGSTLAYPGNLTLGTGDSVHYADVNGDGRADFLVTNPNKSGVEVWLNDFMGSSGAVTWTNAGTSGPLLGSGQLAQVADVSGDGRADLLSVNSTNGAVTLYENDGLNSSGQFDWTDDGQIASGVGGTGSQVRFADLNGDGRADFINVNADSSVTAWLNNGHLGLNGDMWSPLGVIASGVGVPGSEIRFADINGDGKADYLVLNPNGSVNAFLNPGLSNLSGGVGWIPQGEIASGVGDSGSNIQFADIDGDGKADYLDVTPTNGLTKEWQNGGAISGGGWNWIPLGTIANGNADRIVFADLNGDHKADYIDIRADGDTQFWYNGGASSSAPNGWDWIGPVQLSPPGHGYGTDLQFADINGDGIADFLWVNPVSGAVLAHLFNGVTLTDVGEIASGVGSPGRQVRFADINGDGKADYLVVSDSGAVTAWLNGGAGCGSWCWYPQGTVATGVGASGSQVRLAPLYGSGKADYLVVSDSSAVTAWQNGGAGGPTGWIWYPQGVIATGVGDPGGQIQFADINGDGRADYLDVAADGSTKAWLN